MTGQGVAGLAISVVLAFGGGGAFVRYVLERTKARADGRVAESTIELQVDANRLANLEKRLELTVEAHNSERESWHNERESLLRQIGELKTDKQELHAELATTREQVKAMQAELDRIQTRLDQRLNQP